MSTDSPPSDELAPYPTDHDIDAVIQEFSGNLRAAIRALLSDLAVIAADVEQAVSWGYVRGRLPVSEVARKVSGRG